MGFARGLATAAVVCALEWPSRGAETAIPEPVPSAKVIADAVLRGTAWLRLQQDPDGSFGSRAGETALVLLALRHSRIPEDEPCCRRAAEHLLRELPDGTSYGASLGIPA